MRWCHGTQSRCWGLQCSDGQAQPLPGCHPLQRHAKDAFVLCLRSKPELAANPQGRQLGVTLQVQEAGSSGPQHAHPTAGYLTALGEGFAQGVCPGASAHLSHIHVAVAVFIRLLLSLAESGSFYPAQRAGAHSCFCHLIRLTQQCFNP